MGWQHGVWHWVAAAHSAPHGDLDAESLRHPTCARPLHTYMHTMQASFVQVSKVCAGSRRPARNQPQRLVTRARLSDWFSGKNYMADKIGNKVDLNTRDQVQLRLVCGRVSIVRAEAERRRYNSMGFTPELTAGAGGWPLHSRGARGIW